MGRIHRLLRQDDGLDLDRTIPGSGIGPTALKVPYLVNDLRTNTDLFRLESIDENFLNRFLQAGQKPITLYDFQVDLTNQAIKYKRGVIQAPTGSGKAQPLNSVIYTPSGPSRMGDLEIGDLVVAQILHLLLLLAFTRKVARKFTKSLFLMETKSGVARSICGKLMP